MSEEKQLSTRLIHTGDGQNYKNYQTFRFVPETLPIYRTSVFSFDDVPSVDAIYDGEAEGYIYTRIRHPNTDAVGEILAAAEGGGDALVFSTGMSAILVLYSATKYLGGHSDLVGGAAAGNLALIAQIRKKLVLYGAILSASDAWLLAHI